MFEQNPEMARIAAEMPAARTREVVPLVSEAPVPECARTLLKLGVAVVLIHQITGWRPC